MSIEALHTKIEKIIQVNAGLIVLENPVGFPYSESNIYLTEENGHVIWQAEKPESGTLFSRVKLNEDGITFSAYTINSHACDLNLKTGKLVSFTKFQ